MESFRATKAIVSALVVLLAISVVVPATAADADGDIGSFSAAGVLPEDHGGAVASSLADGGLLVVGGDSEAAHVSAFLRDPVDQASLRLEMTVLACRRAAVVFPVAPLAC